MKFILLTLSLFFASNTYAVILNDLYIYQDDSDEDKAIKKELKVLKDEAMRLRLMAFKKHKNNYQRYSKDEVVYRVGDTSKTDVGTKIGMTKEQVINDTYWGKPERVHTIIDEGNIIDSWTYEILGDRNGILGSEGVLYFINGKLTHRLSPFELQSKPSR